MSSSEVGVLKSRLVPFLILHKQLNFYDVIFLPCVSFRKITNQEFRKKKPYSSLFN